MRPGLMHSVCYWIVRVSQWVAISAMVGLLLVPLIEPGQIQTISDWKNLISSNTKPINKVILSIFGVLTVLRKTVGEPWVFNCTKEILRGFQREVFQNLTGGELANHHRVTLYRYQTWCWMPRGRGPIYWPWGKGYWPWNGWLVPIVRAGPETAGVTVFPAGEENFEGVCGAAYSQQSGTLEKKGLPNITATSSDADITLYAKDTFMSVDMIKSRIKRKRPCARYFLALQVYVQSKKWGVIMIDTRAEAPGQPLVVTHRFSQVKDMLDHLLRRA